MVFLPALWCKMMKERMVRTGVNLWKVPRWRANRVCLKGIEKLVLFVFALLMSLLATRSLLHFGRRQSPFLTYIFYAPPTSSPTVCLSTARAKRVSRGRPGQGRKAARGCEQRRLGR